MDQTTVEVVDQHRVLDKESEIVENRRVGHEDRRAQSQTRVTHWVVWTLCNAPVARWNSFLVDEVWDGISRYRGVYIDRFLSGGRRRTFIPVRAVGKARTS